jgi:N-acetylglucosaminyl-diphospho-decaprenol L-rhamnosyltransferase
MPMDDVSAVVVTYRSEPLIGRCIEALRPSGLPIVVVDNASGDGTVELVRERFPDVKVLALAANVGFGSAANRAIETLDSEFVLLLNPDAWPLPDAVERLHACGAAHEEAAVLAPSLEDEAGRPQVSRLGYPTPLWTGTAAVSSFAAPRKRRTPARSFAVGAALLIRSEAFWAVGGFDPDFFLYYEEVDLCMRLEGAGWQIVSCPDARFVHVGGASTRRDWMASYRHQLEGHLRFTRKHCGRRDAERARRVLVAALAVRAVAGGRQARAAARASLPWLRSGGVDELLRRPEQED